MKIWELMDIYDGYVVVKKITQHATTEVVDTRKTIGDFPPDLMQKNITYCYVENPNPEPALTIIIEE